MYNSYYYVKYQKNILIKITLQEKSLGKGKDLYFFCWPCESICRTPGRILWWYMRRFGVQERIIFKKLSPFLWEFNCLKHAEPIRRDTLLLTTKSPGIPGTHLINLRGVKGWVNLGAIHWLWTQDPWIRKPAPTLTNRPFAVDLAKNVTRNGVSIKD